MLIDVHDLHDRLGTVTVLDVRWQLGRTDGLEQHLAGHVPGAAYVDLEADLADPPGDGGRHPLPDTARFVAAMRRCGVDGERPVVVYDAFSGLSAARAWWLLRDHGHRDVRLLDGGWPAWSAAGLPVATGPVTPEAGDFAGAHGRLPVLDADGAAALAAAGRLVDARAPERFRGDVEPVDPVAGHIPGAVNVPIAANLDERGRFRGPDELAAAYARALQGPPHVTLERTDAEVGVYCGSGISAALDVFALALIGRSAALYPGSWSAWVRDPERPVQRGG